MAQRTQITITDDIDGSPAERTISFGVDGTSYEIDLSAAHAEEFREAMRPFIAVARRTGGTARRTARPARPDGSDRGGSKTPGPPDGVSGSAPLPPPAVPTAWPAAGHAPPGIARPTAARRIS